MKNLGRIAFFGVLCLCAWSDLSHAGDTSADPGCEIATHAAHVGGGTLYYNTAGQGRRVLLLHGLFAQKEQWHGMLCLLAAAGYAGIAPDLPGYGKSHGFAVQDYALERQVALLHQLMASIRIEAFDLAGNSMGGTIAALYARQYPRQVRTLAFIGSPLGIVGWNQPVKEAIYQGINPFIPVDMQQVNLELDLLFVKPPSLPEAAKETAVKDYVERNRHYQQIWDIVNLYDTALARAPKVRPPTLIVWGMQDRIFSVDGAARLRSRYPRGALVILPDAGHLAHLENAAESAAIYINFLQRTRASRTVTLR